jgi:hypothetical protein
LHEDNEMRDYRVVIFNDAVLFAVQMSGRLKFKQLAHIGSVSTAANEESPKTSFILTAGSKLYSLSAKSAKTVRQFVEAICSTRELFMETVEKSVDPSKYGTMSVRSGDSQRSTCMYTRRYVPFSTLLTYFPYCIVSRSGSGSFLKRERRVGNLKHLFERSHSRSPVTSLCAPILFRYSSYPFFISNGFCERKGLQRLGKLVNVRGNHRAKERSPTRRANARLLRHFTTKRKVDSRAESGCPSIGIVRSAAVTITPVHSRRCWFPNEIQKGEELF